METPIGSTTITATNRMRKSIAALAGLLALASCYRFDPNEAHYTDGPIWPDYMDVTIPCNIAPLNFCYTSADISKAETVFTAGDMSVSIKGREVVWKESKWKKLLASAAGSSIRVYSSVLDSTWTINVSRDSIDYGITYRRIAPGYEIFSKMGIYERELSSFKERALLENSQFDGCVNCHAVNRGDPSSWTLHIRGPHGATLLSLNGEMEAYNTKADSTLGFCVYPYWHPEGRYIAYSTNTTRQSFHITQEKLIEVFDLASDIQVYDTQAAQLITAPQVKREDKWETFPVFSPDGKTLYFCAADPKPIPLEMDQIRYKLYKVSFDPATGNIGKDVQLLLDAEPQQKSICFPKPSYDGNYIIYTRSDYGNFSIWHHEADIWALDLRDGSTYPVDAVNSADTDSWHNFSSDGRWMVVSSRRDDGLTTRLYFSHMDADGQFGKAFMMPQKHPLHYYSSLMQSYNVPEFVSSPVVLDKVNAQKKINSSERVPFGFRWSE